jgi:hypothetical protein
MVFVSSAIKLLYSKFVQSNCYQYDAVQIVCNEQCPVCCKERAQQ